ncbi:hypothetical protein MnTg01_00457 [archaeon MnTg01]|nr:hypothetical protein MnTg01_00457 [archaeon MnTg01]
MKIKTGFAIFMMFSMMIASTSVVYATPTVSISTEKEIYSYGDFLSFTIQVSEITGESAILYIIDESGEKSSAIPIPVTELKTKVPSPFPFESNVYPLGMYTLEIQYSGGSSMAEFELIDSGNIVIPLWIREFAKYWYNGAITDVEFSNGIGFLIKEGIIVVPETQNQKTSDEVIIPEWIKANTGWWIDRQISDIEFAKGLEFLIKEGIVVVPQGQGTSGDVKVLDVELSSFIKYFKVGIITV